MVEAVSDRPDQRKIDLLLQYILVRAAQEDEWRDRELGPIHLLKYAYLADSAYAERHEGNTFTGAAWRFYHFGPWSEPVHDRIEPALRQIESERKAISGTRHDDDIIRFSILHGADRLRDQLEVELPAGITHTVGHAVHEFGSNTAALLRHVYLTTPMVRAAPGEVLTFLPRSSSSNGTPQNESPRLTARQRQEKKEVLSRLRETVRGRLVQQVSTQQVAVSPAPRYDELFLAGSQWLDALAGEPVENVEGTLTVAPDVWKSPTRSDPDVP